MSESQVSWHVTCRWVINARRHVIGAKWRREVPPSRRLTAREQSSRGPFPVSPRVVPGQPSGSRRWHPVLPPVPAQRLRTLVPATSSPRLVTAAPMPRMPPTLATLACQSTLPSHHATARNAAENKPDAIASVCGNDPLSPSRLSAPADRTGLLRWSRPIPSHRRPTAPSRLRGVGQRPAEIPENSCGLPCHRPGCYVLFRPSPRSPDQHFCSSSCRQALRRVRQREARLRRRRRQGAGLSVVIIADRPRRTPFMSSRIEDAILLE